MKHRFIFVMIQPLCADRWSESRPQSSLALSDSSVVSFTSASTKRGSWRFSSAGTTIERMRAALLAIIPLTESSSATQAIGSTPRLAAQLR